jgi:tRNA/rRNA methyltransferase
LGENIGMCARAMLNCGVTDLRIVRPRDGWPSESAVAASAGAAVVIDNARIFSTTSDAIADLTLIYATTARDRAMTKRVVTPGEAAREIRAAGSQHKCGILFGGEAKGLHNDDIALADHVVTAPLNPAFSSLNLAQAVLILSWEWMMAASVAPASDMRIPDDTRPATKDEMLGLFEHLEGALDLSGFFHVREKRPIMARNLRNLLQRAQPTEQEVRTLRGVIASFAYHLKKE